jgi:hypothetical protein
MSAVNYSSLQATAAQLITSFGTPYTLTRPSINGDVTLAKGVYGTFDKQVVDRFSATAGGTVSMAKKQIYLPAIKNGKVEPQPGDTLSQGAQSWRIDAVDVVRPDGATTIYYTCDIS